MAWIELHEEVRHHPKLGPLSRELGVSRAEARGLVVGLWLWAATYAPEGYLTGFEVADIADGCDYTGDKDILAALIAAKWVDKETLFIHDWDKHGLKMLKSSQERQKKFRERVDRARNAEENPTYEEHVESKPVSQSEDKTLPSRDGNVTVASYLTIPNLTKPTATASHADEAADVDNSKPKDPDLAEERPTAVPAAPGQDLEQVIYDRIGHKKRLSRFDVDKILKLRREHSDTFYPAVDKLHGGVTNVPAFLEKVCLGLAKERDEPAGVKVCRKCGHKWDPWKTGTSFCPSCDKSVTRPGAQITPLITDLAGKMEMTA